jgi:hypothetical protein
MTMRRVLAGLLLLTACHDNTAATPHWGATPITRTTTGAALDSLPIVPVTDGRLLCLSDGHSPCPTSAAAANWLHDGHFAVWEPHHPILIWTPSKADPQLLGEVGHDSTQYDYVISVAASGTGYIVLNGAGMHVMRYNAAGALQTTVPFPQETITHETGYSGDIAFYQVISEGGRDSAANFDVRIVDSPGDTVGRSVFKTPLNWLRLRDSRPTVPLTLFPILPAYAFATDSDVVWSPAILFTVERRSATGKVRWTLTSDATGPAVTAADLAEAHKRLPPDADKAARARFDSSVANTPKFHPAVGGILLAADGRIVVAGVGGPASDSARYVMLSSTGEPTGRFYLPNATRLLLFAGDSILAQRAGANAQQELRWLMVKGPAKR